MSVPTFEYKEIFGAAAAYTWTWLVRAAGRRPMLLLYCLWKIRATVGFKYVGLCVGVVVCNMDLQSVANMKIEESSDNN